MILPNLLELSCFADFLYVFLKSVLSLVFFENPSVESREQKTLRVFCQIDVHEFCLRPSTISWATWTPVSTLRTPRQQSSSRRCRAARRIPPPGSFPYSTSRVAARSKTAAVPVPSRPPAPGQVGQISNLMHEKFSVADSNPDPPDPHVFGPPGSGSISQRYESGSGSGSFYYQARKVRKFRKTLIPTALWLLFDFLSLIFYPRIQIRIRIHSKMSWIRNTGKVNKIWMDIYLSLQWSFPQINIKI